MYKPSFARRQYYSSLPTNHPDYEDPMDEAENEEPDDWRDEAEADYIMTDAENRGIL